MLDVKKIRLILELRESGISDSKILSAIEKIPREKFIPENFRNQAYDNLALPLGSVSYSHLTLPTPPNVSNSREALYVDKETCDREASKTAQ